MINRQFHSNKDVNLNLKQINEEVEEAEDVAKTFQSIGIIGNSRNGPN